MPVLSSSSTSTSPAASTARPDVASTLAPSIRLIPATPIAESSAPIVVGIRQTRSAIEHGDRDRLAGLGRLDAVERVRQERHRREQEDERERGQEDLERDLVRRLAPLRALDHRDHPVDERLAGIDGDSARRSSRRARVPPVTAEKSPPDSRITGADSPVTADSSTEATPSIDLAIARYEIAGLDQHDVALAQLFGGLGIDSASMARLAQPLRPHLLAHRAQGRRLRLAATLGERLGEIREEHGEPQPQRRGPDEPGRGLALTAERIDPQPRGQQAADEDDEHHRVAGLDARVQLAERICDRRADERGIEQRKVLAGHRTGPQCAA